MKPYMIEFDMSPQALTLAASETREGGFPDILSLFLERVATFMLNTDCQGERYTLTGGPWAIPLMPVLCDSPESAERLSKIKGVKSVYPTTIPTSLSYSEEVSKNAEIVEFIVVSRDFHKYPAGRFKAHGPASGEALRDDLIAPALRRGGRVVVDLDEEVLGYGPSFLEEAFGGLARKGEFSAETLLEKLMIQGEPKDARRARQYLEEALQSSDS